MFATEKLDGTNVGKDDAGQIYGRRLLIADDKTDYQQTSLESVRTINISRVKTVFCEIAKIFPCVYRTDADVTGTLPRSRRRRCPL